MFKLMHSIFVLVYGLVIPQPVKPVPEVSVTYASVVASSSRIQLPSPDQIGIGSRFGDPGDEWTGGRMFCSPHAYVSPKEFVCAHRYYPCGTILIIEYGSKRSWCVVADRGPYGANVFAANGKIVNDGSGHPAWYVMGDRHSPPPDDLCRDGGCRGRWRGVIDMTRAVTDHMGHPGWGYVRIWTLRRVVNYQKYLAKKTMPPTT